MEIARRAMVARLLAASLLIATLAVDVSPEAAAQDGAAPAQEARRRPRFPAEPSDLITHSPLTSCSADDPARSPRRSRIATWNIRAARSAPLDAIASEIMSMQADLVALQEVDVRTRRTGFVDEPAVLAAALGFHYVFAASIKWDEGDYGLAVVSRWPLVDVRRHRLDATLAGEQRIVLEATVCADGRPLRVFNHHGDIRAASREVGFGELKGIVQPHLGRRILVLGDFNEASDAPGVRGLIDAGLVDLGAVDNAKTAEHGRIDYLLADGPLASLMSAARVWPTDKSDHHAVLADLEW